MDVMTGGTGNPLSEMLGLHPVDILLVVAFGKFVGVDMLDVALGKGGRAVVCFEGFSGFVTNRPTYTFLFGSFAAVVARATDLNGNPHGKFGRIDDGLAFLEYSSLRQGRMP